MRHHAYVIAGTKESTEASIHRFIERDLEMVYDRNPDILSFSYGLFSVDDARAFAARAYQSSSSSGGKVLIASADRFFHEAQNALLKVFEEPPTDTTLIVHVPNLGILLPTLRSRLMILPGTEEREANPSRADEFLSRTPQERSSYITKLIERSKSDKEAEKQEARNEAHALLGDLAQTGYAARATQGAAPDPELNAFLADLSAFMPLLHERSTPLKLIFEHLLLVIPKRLIRPIV